MKEVFGLKSKLGLASILFIGVSLLLKISGLIRDMVIAYYFGDSYVTDAYYAAFIIPNMLILFLTTGMKNAFVPSYIDALEERRGASHLGQIFKGTAVISLVLALLGLLVSPYLIPLLYPEFSVDASRIAVHITMIFFCAIFFVGMNSVLEAFLDAENKFSLSIISQIIVLLSSIVAAFIFANQIGVYSLAVGYFVGTIISLIFKFLLVIPQKKIKWREKFNWIEIKHFYFIFIPVGLTVAVGQINLLVGTIFASHFDEGAVTYINYAKNLVHIPQAIFGVTIGTIIFPMLSKAISTDNNALFKRGIVYGLNTMYFILLPAVVGMMVLMPNIIELLYQRGAFTSEATIATTQVAYLYFGSVLFFSLNNVINKGFYSLKKGHMILLISGLSVLVNIVLNVIFTSWIGYKGIALAASVNAFIYVLGQFVIFLKLVKGLNLKAILIEFSKITFGTLIMGVAAWWTLEVVHNFSNILQIGIVAIVGVIVYLICAYVLRMKSFKFLLKNLAGKGAVEKEPIS